MVDVEEDKSQNKYEHIEVFPVREREVDVVYFTAAGIDVTADATAEVHAVVATAEMDSALYEKKCYLPEMKWMDV